MGGALVSIKKQFDEWEEDLDCSKSMNCERCWEDEGRLCSRKARLTDIWEKRGRL